MSTISTVKEKWSHWRENCQWCTQRTRELQEEFPGNLVTVEGGPHARRTTERVFGPGSGCLHYEIRVNPPRP